ncbi:LacI family DNA-binding transcriptional regulator [Amaricoccus solimangrovi]|uniref:Substrate-binding domain-containing protein n=1 Tax=Amaricoccus solimangrovi TaxID=2589815 RepID=A0A501WJ82_9RHOB|nr:LacI family DNA-binding transcriptional regulator [Amaricoccus solimangrovi]TPE49569.1 substrate-binding domain-containing protein [Amaricoccus solimangrovi]
MRPTIRDVAREAGVSLASVDRVLNRRPGVRAGTILRVEAAVARLGFVRDLAAANLSRRRDYRFVFLIPTGPNTFMRELEAEARALGEQVRPARVAVEVVGVPPFDGEALAAALDALAPGEVSGVALVGTDAAVARDALVRLAAAGVPVVTLVSDVPFAPRSRYVGIDNVAAGRTAASLLGRFLGPRGGTVALVAGSMLVRDHVERRMGFEQVARAEFPRLSPLPVIEGRDDAAATRAALAALMAREPGIAGLYNMGAGNRGVIDLLRALPESGRPLAVAHELTPHTRAALRAGLIQAVIHQDAGHEARSALRILRAAAEGAPLNEAQERIRVEVYLRDNAP